MSIRRSGEYDESDVKVRSGRGSRPRTKTRPEHADAEAAMVVTVDRGRWGCVLDGDPGRPVTAMRARELGRTPIVVGDEVDIVGDLSGRTDSLARIVRRGPRRTVLRRTADDTDPTERVVVANLDQVLVVFAAANPEPHPRMADRFLVIAEANGLDARIVVNKCDLVSAERSRALFAEHAAAGYPVHYTSVKTGEGLDELRAEVGGRSSALSGPSGVGKSSLMNTLFPGLNLRTAAISESVNKGRHTTVGAVLHPLPGGGFLADTPGLREVGLWGIDPADVAHCFPEFRPFRLPPQA